MQVYVENKRGQRFRVLEGWQSARTVFENDAAAELLISFPPAALDQIYDQFLAHRAQCSVDTHTLGGGASHLLSEFPGVPTHFSSEHKAVYTAVRKHQILIEEAPFGEAVLEERQSGIRHKIRLALQKIVAEERVEAARIQAVHEKRSELEKVGAHIARGAQGFGEAVWGLAVWVKDVAEVAMVVRSTRVQYEMLGATYDYIAHDRSFEASGSEYLGEVKKEVVDVLGFDPSTITAEQLKQAFEIAELIYDDATLRSDIGRFAKDYVKAQHSLEISEFAGGGVFEIVLTIVLAAFTGGVGAVGSMAKNARLMFRFKDVGDLMLDFAKFQKQRLRLKMKRGAKSSAANFSDLDSDVVSVPKYSDEPVGGRDKRPAPLPLSDIELAKKPGNAPAQIRARRSIAREYMENNGFTEDQITDALGTLDGAAEGGVDFEKPLEIVSFPPPEDMYQHVKSHGYPGNWFDPVGGQSPDQLGISGEGRMSKKFKMPKGTGLKSHSRPILDNWTNPENPVQTPGGGVQLVINDEAKALVNSLNGLN